MSDKNTLEIIDNTLQSVEDNFKKFIEVLETAKSELIILEKDKKQLSKDKNTLEEQKLYLEEEKAKLGMKK